MGDILRALCLRPLVASFAGTVVVAGALVTGCTNDCLKGQSAVGLNVPVGRGWVLEEYCVDDECLSADERQPRPRDYSMVGEPVYYLVLINVRDRPDTYHYRVKLTAPDGRSVVHDGEVETKGNRMGGERCNPTTFTAVLMVEFNGELTRSR